MVPKNCPKWVQNGSKMGPKWDQKWQKSNFSARDLRFTLDIHFHKWWYDWNLKLSKFYSMLPKRVQTGPKGSKLGPKWVQRRQKSSFWARDLRFTLDVCSYHSWKDLDSKVYSMVPKKGPKGSKMGLKWVQNGSKNDKNQNFYLETWDSHRMSVFMTDERIFEHTHL